MVDPEVERLRRLRGAALRLRAVARELGSRGVSPGDSLLSRGACAGWRIARTVSGRLRAHPFADFQQDASVGVLLQNAIAAKWAARAATDRSRALQAFDRQLRRVARQLDDARALCWDGDLSDSLGRSQTEFRALAAETSAAVRTPLPALVRSAPVTPAGSDWPFVAL